MLLAFNSNHAHIRLSPNFKHPCMDTLHPLFSEILSAHAARPADAGVPWEVLEDAKERGTNLLRLVNEAAMAAGALKGAAEALRQQDCPATARMLDERAAALEVLLLSMHVRQDSDHQEVA